MVRAHVTYFASNMAALKVCSHELDALTRPGYEETRRIRHEYYDHTRTIVDRIIEQHAADGTIDRHVATMSLYSMLNWLYRWYSPGPERTPTGLANQIVRLFLRGIVGVAPRTDIDEGK